VKANKEHRKIDDMECKAQPFTLEDIEKESQDLKQNKEDVVIDFAIL
jgi:hypothetical protein